MDGMLGENKNLKDPERKLTASYGAGPITNVLGELSYTKTNKLITALFMVTDIMDKDEPLRNKLRFLGTGIISDTYLNPADSDKKISEVLTLLDICREIRMVSEMNSNILKKEFEELQRSVRTFSPKKDPVWLEEFLKDEEKEVEPFIKTSPAFPPRIGHVQPTSIGIQKGSTLLKALRGVSVSDKNSNFVQPKNPHSTISNNHTSNLNYEVLKNKRREEIVSIIKNKLSVFPESGGATITDIKNSAEGPLVSCGEKTLQRELVSMVHDGVLYKTGEKRWSKYSLKKA